MYLSELRIWNFRKFGTKEINGTPNPGMILNFKPGFNVLVGENDTGKTAIIDAIKLVLLTQSYESIRIEHEDFYIANGVAEENRTKEMKIECIFRGFSENEAKNFLEWMAFEEVSQGNTSYFLKLTLKAQRENGKVYSDVKAGPDDEGAFLDGKARDLLRVTYLKPLRDAENELSPRRNSRLSQILDSHDAFTDKEKHHLVSLIKKANTDIENYFKGIDGNGIAIPDQKGNVLLEEINTYLIEFSDRRNPLKSNFSIAEMKLRTILEKLSLNLSENKVGLGSHNLLFIAAEMLLLKRINYTGLSLALIEEIEAHLHPQAQLRLIDYLQKECDSQDIQIILTTHSPNLSSKVDLRHLIIMQNGLNFPMGSEYTDLYEGDYLFLQRFLDATKANLFFAQGVILVEGDAENILIPTIAEIIGYPLSHYGVSVVNVGSTAFLRYARIFQRKVEPVMSIPVACITDIDVKPDEKVLAKDTEALRMHKSTLESEERRKCALYDKQCVKTFVSPDWTLEYCIAASTLVDDFYKAIKKAKIIQNADNNGWDYDKITMLNNQITMQDIEEWRSQGLNKETIAYKIYNDIVIKPTNKVSKAIIAQCFSEILYQKDKQKLKSQLEADAMLTYLIKAIKYACGEAGDI